MEFPLYGPGLFPRQSPKRPYPTFPSCSSWPLAAARNAPDRYPLRPPVPQILPRYFCAPIRSTVLFVPDSGRAKPQPRKDVNP